MFERNARLATEYVTLRHSVQKFEKTNRNPRRDVLAQRIGCQHASHSSGHTSVCFSPRVPISRRQFRMYDLLFPLTSQRESGENDILGARVVLLRTLRGAGTVQAKGYLTHPTMTLHAIHACSRIRKPREDRRSRPSRPSSARVPHSARRSSLEDPSRRIPRRGQRLSQKKILQFEGRRRASSLSQALHFTHLLYVCGALPRSAVTFDTCKSDLLWH